MILNRKGDSELAKIISTSLREHATTNDDFGELWEKNTNGYYWYNSSIDTHVALMLALAEVDYNKEEIENLKLWLLKQKQTQSWER